MAGIPTSAGVFAGTSMKNEFLMVVLKAVQTKVKISN
jgi:hypothetical protein